ncbi:AbrB/MazE/SpoVT family DNA-binding domain-containing protein [Halovenus sp. HT40]|uniref:AbrB/MazE/SpoVT family DNA-binding domain-containing protein n=1 Tax=Halovenus sp. HT40 TaxID=3126691 RepID=UPI00300E89BE
MRGGNPVRSNRKLQQVGSSTLAVTLPVDWVEKQGLSKGDEVVVQRDESGGSLLVVPNDPHENEQSVEIDADEFSPEQFRQVLLTQYILGRHQVTVTSSDGLSNEQFNVVIELEQQLMGFGVVEQTQQRVVIRCSVAVKEFDIRNLLERLARTEAGIRAAAVSVALGEQETLPDRQEQQLWRLFCLFLRLVFTTYRNPRLNDAVGIDTGFPLIGYRSVGTDLVMMAGSSRQLAESGKQTGLDRQQRVDLADAVDEAVTATVAVVVEPTHDDVESARTMIAETRTQFEETATDTGPEGTRLLPYFRTILDHAERMQAVAARLAYREAETKNETEDETRV